MLKQNVFEVKAIHRVSLHVFSSLNSENLCLASITLLALEEWELCVLLTRHLLPLDYHLERTRNNNIVKSLGDYRRALDSYTEASTAAVSSGLCSQSMRCLAVGADLWRIRAAPDRYVAYHSLYYTTTIILDVERIKHLERYHDGGD